MPSQLNGKRAPDGSKDLSGQTALPPQRYGGRRGLPASPASALTPLKARAFGKVADVAPPARIPASKRAEPRARPMSHATAGKRLPASCGTFFMTCHLEAPRPSRQRRGRIALALRLTLLVSLASVIDAVAADNSLAPVVITATREPEAIGRSTADIVVIDTDTIRRTSADSVEDLIRRVAGIQVVRNGGPGQSSGFFIRGASTNSTVVLVDGVRVGSATLGQAEFEAFSLAQIERIEVLRGPASSLYGADAVGGVVQIFTRRGEGAPRGERGGRGRRLPLVARRRRRERRGRSLGLRALARPRGKPRRIGDRARRPVRPVQPRRRRLQARLGNAAARLHAGAGPSHRRAPARDASERTVRRDGGRRPSTIPRPTFAIAWSRESPRSTTAASRPARGPRRSRPPARSTT